MAALLWQKQLPAAIGGAMFENAVFSELLKQRGMHDLFYWRTQDKKEIDFVLKRGQKFALFEAKMNAASFKSTALDYFNEKYGRVPFHCVTLEPPSGKTQAKIDYCFPWEMAFKPDA
jgi:predicted AAA+ superfamily ATPase